jgi:hypothetical protein
MKIREVTNFDGSTCLVAVPETPEDLYRAAAYSQPELDPPDQPGLTAAAGKPDAMQILAALCVLVLIVGALWLLKIILLGSVALVMAALFPYLFAVALVGSVTRAIFGPPPRSSGHRPFPSTHADQFFTHLGFLEHRNGKSG